MWIPTTVEELEGSVQRGEVEESATLDFKREIPSKNKDTAKDLAAMANDGGVLIYGVGEDSERRPTQLAPLTLKRQAERLTQIAQSALSPPLEITPKSLRREGAEGQGYLVVVVPASPSAPHQVTVEGDCRFYGRNAAGNQILTEGDVSRLYERRKRWEVDREALLDRVIQGAREDFHPNDSCLFMFARPVTAAEGLLARLGDRAQQRELIRAWVTTAHVSASWKGRRPNTNPEPRDFGWFVDQTTDNTRRTISIDLEGLTCLRSTSWALRHESVPLLDIELLEQDIWFFLGVVRAAYLALSTMAAIDPGLALTGMEEMRLVRRHPHQTRDIQFGHHRPRFVGKSYRRTIRVWSTEIETSPQSVVRALVHRLAHAFDQEVEEIFALEGWAAESKPG